MNLRLRFGFSFPSSEFVLLPRVDIVKCGLALHRSLPGGPHGASLAGRSNDLASVEAAVADLVGGVVEEVGKLAEHLGLEVELLLLLAPVVDGVLQMLQPVVHVVVEGLEGVQGLVVAVIDAVDKVRKAEGAQTANHRGGVQVLRGSEKILFTDVKLMKLPPHE